MHPRRHAPTGNLATCGFIAIALWVLACSSPEQQLARPEPRPAEPGLIFENATTEPVAIYLVENTSKWLVGHAEPGRTHVLRLPAAMGARRGREFSILVVRAGGRRDQPSFRSSQTDVTRSEIISGEHITAIRWKLAGRQLVALPLVSVPPGVR